MLKKFVVMSVIASSSLFAADEIDLYKQPLSTLSQFSMVSDKPAKALALMQVNNKNQLIEISTTSLKGERYIRYQQMYQGIPVVGSQVTVHKPGYRLAAATTQSSVSGHLTTDLSIDTHAKYTKQQIIDQAKTLYLDNNSAAVWQQSAQLEIRLKENTPRLMYKVSLKSQINNHPKWIILLLDANTGELIKRWNNLKTFQDTGIGGNSKVGRYWYGRDELPGLEVEKKGKNCTMKNNRVSLVSLFQHWDWENQFLTPLSYSCGSDQDKEINGAYAPANDAFAMGDIIIGLYRDWYGLNALQLPNGEPMQLIMRVHFGAGYDNAFWDGETMSFGDGDEFYPLVSLDVAGHEVSHGFTEQHSDLEYHDEPGSLNESFSDMAGISAEAYLLETHALLYQTMYGTMENRLNWGIGSSITKPALGSEALRFMDVPSRDGFSADCLDKDLANNNQGNCAISYSELVSTIKASIDDPDAQQDYIVHTGSGVYNKFFYLLAQEIGVRNAFGIMAQANIKYWTPSSDFKQAACGVLRASNDVQQNLETVKMQFLRIGIDTNFCQVN